MTEFDLSRSDGFGQGIAHFNMYFMTMSCISCYWWNL